MEVRAGYKLTEVGMIPEDWEVKRIADFASVGSGGTPSRAIAAYWNGSIPWITTSQIDFGTIYEAQQFITDEGLQNSAAKLLPAGTLLMALYGQGKTRGKVGVLGSPASTNQACASIALDESVSREFILQYLTSRYEEIRTSSNSGSQENLSGSIVKGLLVASPQLPEQRAIAAALSDADALLAGLDRLIVKKRDLKQAAMQQLLTGKTRLPGFQGEWESRTFGQVAQPRRDRVDPRSSGIQEFCVELEHIAPAGGELFGHTSAGEQSSIKSVFSTGDVLFGKLRAYLRKYWLATRPGVCSTEIWVFAPKRHLMTTEFLFQLVKTDDFIEAASNSYGTHMPRSDWSIVKNFELALPLVPEQAAIAAVLSDMDAELSALKARREKTQSLKQAMMQELLTGRTRLV